MICNNSAQTRNAEETVKHADIWRALDTLAAENGLSSSGLARCAGLDPTAFNASKRSHGGRLRWPSSESLAKVLDATGVSLDAFTALVTGARALPQSRPARRIPLLGSAQAVDEGLFDESGYPTGTAWDETAPPEIADPHAYALEIGGDAFEPVFRDGDVLLVSPAAPIRRGDRVVLRLTAARTASHDMLIGLLSRQSARRAELRSLGLNQPNRSFALEDVAWMHRIVWASQ